MAEDDETSEDRRRVRLGRADAVTAVALIGAAVALLFSGLRLNEYLDHRDDARAAAEHAVVTATRSSALAVDALLAEMQATVDGVAAGLSDGTIDDRLEAVLSRTDGSAAVADQASCADPDPPPVELESALCAAAAGIPELNGIGVVFSTQFDPANRYRPYANRIGGPLSLGELVARDFERTDWYRNAVERTTVAGGAGGAWTHPRFGLTSQKLLAYYAAPFYADDGVTVRGVVLATYALDRLAADLRWLGVGSTGYSIILSDTGTVVSHPSEELVIAEVEGSPRLGSDLRPTASRTVADLKAAVAAASTPFGFVTGVADDVTDRRAWIAWSPIETVGWTYGAVTVEREVFTRTVDQNRLLLAAGLGLLAGVLLIVVAVFGRRATDHRLWVISISAGALAAVGIGWIWYVTITGPDPDAPDDVAGPAAAMIDPSIDPSFDPSVAALGGDGTVGPLFAGVFVQSVEFTGANDVTVSGIVWQEQRDDAGVVTPPGFVFPEADEVSLEEQYRATEGNLTRVGWSFTASLRQTFDYSRYPLDRETVWLRLWPADYTRSFLMLPELGSYETLAPSSRPGIERDFVVEGWQLEASSFSYRDNEYNTDFGLRDISTDATPELYFNVHLKRSFLDAAMSQLVPISVVAVLLFGVLLITTRHRADDDALDFSALGVLGYCAALFFVAIIAHEQLRASLNSGEVIYLEYFYFATYVAILAVSTNAILVGAGRGGRFVEYRDNLLPSLLYWPTLNGVILLATVVSFS